MGVGSMAVSVVSTAAGGAERGRGQGGARAGPTGQPAPSIGTQDSGRLK